MPQTPIEILESAYANAWNEPIEALLSRLPDARVQDLITIVDYAETQKAILGVTITCIVYKIYEPEQDIRQHQKSLPGGYSGRTFDTKYVTPFLKGKFPHFAMAESAWLTRSLEQHHPFDLAFPGRIRSKTLKSAFLHTVDFLQNNGHLAWQILVVLIALMLQATTQDSALFTQTQVPGHISIIQIANAIKQHIHYNYGQGVVGTARLPVLAIYSIYNLLMPNIKRYSGKTLAPLQSHTSPDFRSKSLGDIDIYNEDGSCFESIEIKHLKPITADMIGTAWRKIKDTEVNRYYILTTHDPYCNDSESMIRAINSHSQDSLCQIVVNGVIPSLKYYMRLLDNPQDMIPEYTQWLQFEFRRASGVKKDHLRAWQEICQNILHIEPIILEE